MDVAWVDVDWADSSGVGVSSAVFWSAVVQAESVTAVRSVAAREGSVLMQLTVFGVGRGGSSS